MKGCSNSLKSRLGWTVIVLMMALLCSLQVAFADTMPDGTPISEDWTTTSATDDSVYFGIYGSYYTDAKEAVARVNAIRYEACKEGVPNPNNPSVNLTLDDYVAIKWSYDMECISRTRAAEAALTTAHQRLNGTSIWTIVSPNGLTSSAEDLAWNFDKTMVSGIEQFYAEKADWLAVCAGEKSAQTTVTGHYTSMINPRYTSMGMACFYSSEGRYPNSVALELTANAKASDTTMLPEKTNIMQKVRIAKSSIAGYGFLNGETIYSGEKLSLVPIANVTYGSQNFKLHLLDTLSFSSSNTTIASIDTNNCIHGNSLGDVTITMKKSGTTLASVLFHVICQHDYQTTATNADGTIDVVCSKCSESNTINPPTNLTIYWKNPTTNVDGYYWSSFPSENPVGSEIYCWPQCSGGDEVYRDLVIKCSDETILKMPEKFVNNASANTLKVLKSGIVTLTIQSRFYPALSHTYTVIVGDQGGISISDATVQFATVSDFSASGVAREPSVSVSMNGKTLYQGTHYTVSYKNNIKAGTATAIVSGIGYFSGTKELSFHIHDYESGTITADGTLELTCSICHKSITVVVPTTMTVYWRASDATNSYYSSGMPARLNVNTTLYCWPNVNGDSGYDGLVITSSDESVIQIPDHVTANSAYNELKVLKSGITTITVKSEYNPSLTYSYIAAVGADGSVSIADADVTLSQNTYTYNGSACKPTPTVTVKGTKLTSSVHYTCSYESNVEAGTGVVIITGTGLFTGTKRVNFKINGTSISAGTLTLGQSSYEYDGTAKQPTVTVKVGTKTLVKGTDYTVAYQKNTAIGTATVTVTGIGSYSGTLTKNFSIVHTTHSWTSTVVAPTCTTAGYTSKACKYCDAVQTTDQKAALGHNYSATPTWTGTSSCTFAVVCANDASHKATVNATITSAVTKAATCTATGVRTYTAKATYGGKTFTATKTATIAKTAHSYVDSTVAPTCTQQGYDLHACKNCSDATKSNYKAAIGHDYEPSYAWASDGKTCTISGKCNNNGSHVLPAVTLATEVVSNQPATYAAAGETVYRVNSIYGGLTFDDTYVVKIPMLKLTAPTVSLSDPADGVKVTWTKSEGAAGYYVYRKSGGSGYSRIATVSASTTSYSDTTVVSGTDYTYTVRAYNGSNKSTYTGKTIRHLAMPVVSVKNIVKGVNISWPQTTGASGYYIYRKTSSGSYTLIKTITSGSTVSYTDTTAAAGTTYRYAVKAYSGSYKSDYTGTSIRRLTAPTTTLTNASKGVQLKWNKTTGATGYYIYRSTNDGSFVKVATVTGSSTLSYLDTKTTKGYTYKYRVRAYYETTSSMSSYNTTSAITRK